MTTILTHPASPHIWIHAQRLLAADLSCEERLLYVECCGLLAERRVRADIATIARLLGLPREECESPWEDLLARRPPFLRVNRGYLVNARPDIVRFRRWGR